MKRPTFILLALIITACSYQPVPPRSTPEAPRPATATAFQAEPPTPTPGPVALWISSQAPSDLRASAQAIGVIAGRPVVEANSPHDADLLFGSAPEVAVAERVYALVAPFPSLTDSVSLESLQSAWSSGRFDSGVPLLADPETISALRARFGEQGLEIVSRQALLDLAWDRRPSRAIVPFEALEPRWKVLAIDGISPLDSGFSSASYGLVVRYGFSGDAGLNQAAAERFTGVMTNRDTDKLSVVIVTGVSALARATGWRMEAEGPEWPAELIGSWLASADITHISHEVPLSDLCPPPDPNPDQMRFCGQPEHADLFEAVGADVIELTGNHVLDHSPAAFLDTLDLYDQKGWLIYGGGRNLEEARQPAILEHHGHRFAFVGCNQPGPPWAFATETGPGALECDFDTFFDEITALREDGYLPIVTFQWAESYRNWPLPNQRAAFQRAAEAGAVIVSGSQAHQPQGFEFYSDALIHYGLGNLFFDQMWSTETRQEMIDRHVFYDGRHIGTQVFTAFLEDYAQPRPMTPDERTSFLGEIFAASGW